jgi:hypothetical protein
VSAAAARRVVLKLLLLLLLLLLVQVCRRSISLAGLWRSCSRTGRVAITTECIDMQQLVTRYLPLFCSACPRKGIAPTLPVVSFSL